jgi:hypothetical protein
MNMPTFKIGTAASDGTEKDTVLSASDKIVLEIDFSEEVSGYSNLPTGTDSTIVSIGGNAVESTWSVSGNSLQLSYTIPAGVSGAISINEAALASALTDAAIQDSAGNALVIPYFTIADPTNVVDSSSPAIDSYDVIVSTYGSDGSLKSGSLKATDKVVVALDLGEDSANLSNLPTGTDSTIVSIGGNAVESTWSVSGNSLQLSYTIPSGVSGAISINEAALASALIDAAIQDSAGNALVIPSFEIADPTNVIDSSILLLESSVSLSSQIDLLINELVSSNDPVSLQSLSYELAAYTAAARIRDVLLGGSEDAKYLIADYQHLGFERINSSNVGLVNTVIKTALQNGAVGDLMVLVQSALSDFEDLLTLVTPSDSALDNAVFITEDPTARLSILAGKLDEGLGDSDYDDVLVGFLREQMYEASSNQVLATYEAQGTELLRSIMLPSELLSGLSSSDFLSVEGRDVSGNWIQIE